MHVAVFLSSDDFGCQPSMQLNNELHFGSSAQHVDLSTARLHSVPAQFLLAANERYAFEASCTSDFLM